MKVTEVLGGFDGGGGALRIIGALALLVSALLYIKARSAYHNRALSCYKEILSHLNALRRYISSSLGTISGYLSSRVEGGERLARALVEGDEETKTGFVAELSVSCEARAALLEYLSTCGRGYLSDEMKLLDGCIAELEAEYEKEKSEGGRALKVCSVFAVSLAVGAVILFL